MVYKLALDPRRQDAGRRARPERQGGGAEVSEGSSYRSLQPRIPKPKPAGLKSRNVHCDAGFRGSQGPPVCNAFGVLAAWA